MVIDVITEEIFSFLSNGKESSSKIYCIVIRKSFRIFLQQNF